ARGLKKGFGKPVGLASSSPRLCSRRVRRWFSLSPLSACTVSWHVPFHYARESLHCALGASNARILGDILTSAMITIALGMGGGLALVATLHRPIAAWTESSL